MMLNICYTTYNKSSQIVPNNGHNWPSAVLKNWPERLTALTQVILLHLMHYLEAATKQTVL